MGLISDIMARGKIAAQGKEMARQSAEFNILAGQAIGFRRQTGLGVLGTSQLVNSFQWGLIEEGWSREFAKDIGNQLAVKLAGTSTG